MKNFKTRPMLENKTKKFTFNLQNLVKYHAVTIKGMSKSTNLDRTHLRRLLRGEISNPGLEALEKLARFFSISIAQLVGEQEIDFKNKPKELVLNPDKTITD